MQIRHEYKSATGEIISIEIDTKWNEILDDYDHQDELSERRFNRNNPVSLSSADFEGRLFSAGEDILEDLIKAVDCQKLREVLKTLPERQQDLIYRVYFKGEKIVDIAKESRVSEGAIRKVLKKSHAALKNFF
jgi:RNA polymerase sigma factor (sigma-70 family)